MVVEISRGDMVQRRLKKLLKKEHFGMAKRRAMQRCGVERGGFGSKERATADIRSLTCLIDHCRAAQRCEAERGEFGIKPSLAHVRQALSPV